MCRIEVRGLVSPYCRTADAYFRCNLFTCPSLLRQFPDFFYRLFLFFIGRIVLPGGEVFLLGLFLPVVSSPFPLIMGSRHGKPYIRSHKRSHHALRRICQPFKKMKAVADLYDSCICLSHGAVIRYGAITGDNLEIGKGGQPFRHVTDLPRGEQVYDPVSVDIYHDSSVCMPFFKGKVIYAYLCGLPFIWKGYIFFLRDCRWCSSLHPLSRLSACPTHLPN